MTETIGRQNEAIEIETEHQSAFTLMDRWHQSTRRKNGAIEIRTEQLMLFKIDGHLTANYKEKGQLWVLSSYGGGSGNEDVDGVNGDGG